jgi:tRNA dimethylallyltransferase
MDQKYPLIIIAGPTASGKSALALALSSILASVLPVTLINMDASQVYQDLRIVSARPSIEEEAQAPHALFGYIDGAQACSAARWADDAKAAIVEARAAGRMPVLVGGTGLYLNTLLNGIAPIPDIDPGIRADVRAMDVAVAYAALEQHDPDAAQRLNRQDKTRIMRALEVFLSTGQTLGAWQSEMTGGIFEEIRPVPLVLLPPREWLYQRCDDRFAAMLDAGQDEIAALMKRGLAPELPVMRAIGVAEVAAFMDGRMSRQEALLSGQLATRHYAKRQYTWFRNQLPENWARFSEELNSDNVNKLVIKLREMALTE